MFSDGYLLSCEGHDFNTKVFQRLLNSLEPFSGKKPQLHYSGSHRSKFQDKCLFVYLLFRASDISRKKRQNFAGFSGANSRKNWPISREKSQNSLKNRPISWDFRGRKVKIRRKIGRFRRILAEKVKFRRIFGANS